MSLDQETINQQLQQLTSHRLRLALLLQQQAKLGGYTPPYVLIDIQEAQSAIHRIKKQLRADGVLVEDEPDDDVQPAAVLTPSRLSRQEQRNRRAMLAKVKAIWIDGLLEQSLAKELRIALDLTEQPDAVDLPLNALVQELNHPPRSLPTGTAIIQVFEQMSGALLILGAPGAGKTTLLLELARDVIARAEQDEEYPIPVVFNLSSWAEKRRPLKAWLVEELNRQYDVPRKLAQAWIDRDIVLPLLDGLDEVAAAHREACVEAINTYRQAHGLVPLAVCSRVADYEALTTKLRLQGAIVVQPLTEQQIDDYLERAGAKLAGVRAALHNNVQLEEMLNTPLMLSVMTLAYAQKAAAEVQAVGTSDEWQRHLFDAYIEAMFGRRGAAMDYTREQTERWLRWMAQGMMQQAQSVFFIEQLQPNWLPTRAARLHYTAIDRLGGALGAGLGVGLSVGISFGLGYGLSKGLNNGLGFGLVAWLGVGLLGRTNESQAASHWDIWQIAYRISLSILVFGLVGGLSGWLRYGLNRILPVGLYFGLIGVLGALKLGGPSLRPRYITVVETTRWLWSKGLCFGVCFGLIVGLTSVPIYGLSDDLRYSLIFGLVYGLSIGLTFGMAVKEIETTNLPNQGIWRSARSAVKVGLGVGLVSGLGGILGGTLVGELRFGLVYGLSSAAFISLGSGVVSGGFACLHHLALRLVLYHTGCIPWNYARFLDYCAERIFLRRVGGGYIFVHRLLMEHFASLYTEKTQKM